MNTESNLAIRFGREPRTSLISTINVYDRKLDTAGACRFFQLIAPDLTDLVVLVNEPFGAELRAGDNRLT